MLPKIPITQRLNTYISLIMALAMALDLTLLKAVLPEEWAAKVMGAVALLIVLCKVYLTWNAQHFNPDGTPASQPYQPPK